MNSKFRSLIPVISLLALGGALRFAALGSVPDGMHQDEAFVAWNGFALFHEGMDSAGHCFPVYMADWGDGHSALYVWLLLPLLALTGGDITPFLSRFPQAAVSVLTLWVVYLLFKRLFDAGAGLWSLFLLAVCPWHIMMSRWGLDANLAPGFLIFGLYFFIRGLEQPKFLPLSGLFYGLSLYAYAVIWPLVPILVLLQSAYGLARKKLTLNPWSLFAGAILFVLALPLLLFLLVNQDFLPEICLPFITIPRMNGYRGSEVALTLPEMWQNLRTALSLLWHQNTGAPYDILLPWGLFYDIGRFFIVVGVIALSVRLVKCFRAKSFAGECFVYIQLLAGGLNCMLVTAKLHQINSLYIPFVLAEAYGVWSTITFLEKKNFFSVLTPARMKTLSTCVLSAAYLLCLFLFQRDYYTDYRRLAGAYYAQGLEECVDYALNQCKASNISVITAEKGAQWPRLLLYTKTLPSEYLASVTYDVPPAPASFETKGIHVNTRIDYNALNQDSIYIIYYTDLEVFEKDFILTGFFDWYVAVPRRANAAFHGTAP